VPAADQLLHHRIHGLRPQTPRLPPQRKRRKQHQLSTRRRWTAVALLHGLRRDDTRSPSLTNVSLAGLLVEPQARHSSDEYRAPSSPKIPTGRLVVVRQQLCRRQRAIRSQLRASCSCPKAINPWPAHPFSRASRSPQPSSLPSLALLLVFAHDESMCLCAPVHVETLTEMSSEYVECRRNYTPSYRTCART
jgi:hypothetical protein